MTVFTDRADAGRRLAHRMKTHRGEDVVVLGLPRGGVVVAYEVALALGAPLDVVVVRKLGVPYQPEVAMGAIGEDGVRVIDEDTVAHAGITEDELAAIERRERALLDTRVAHYRAGRERVDLTGRLALIVDDGMATGATARAACQVARRLAPRTGVHPGMRRRRDRHEAVAGARNLRQQSQQRMASLFNCHGKG